MSDWTWEFVPDAASVVSGLTQAQIDEVESLASRIADAVAVRRIGSGPAVWRSREGHGPAGVKIFSVTSRL